MVISSNLVFQIISYNYLTIPNFGEKSEMTLTRTPEGGGGVLSYMGYIGVCAAVKGMVFKQFNLG